MTASLTFRRCSRWLIALAATLLLSGLAMNALTSAILGYIIYLATETQVRALTFWMLGSLGGAMNNVLLAFSVDGK